MNLRRISYGVLIGIFLLLGIGAASAETIPATSVPGTPQAGYVTNPYGKWGATANEACNRAAPPSGYASGSACYYTFGWIANVVPGTACWNSDGVQIACATTYTCPPNEGWTLSGQTCTRVECGAGEWRNSSGACMKDCSNHMGQTAGGGAFEYGNPGGAAPGNTTAVNGCQVACGNSVSVDGVAAGFDCKYTGKNSGDGDAPYIGPTSKPDPNRTPPAQPSDCGVKGMGYIQGSTGQITCVPAESSPETAPTVSSDKSSASGKPGAGSPAVPGTATSPGTPAVPAGEADPSSPDYKKTDSSTKTGGGNTTTTEKVTTNPNPDANGTANGGCASNAVLEGGKCVETKVTTQSTGDYCAQNPNAVACKPYKDACVENPKRAGCADMTGGNDGDGGEVQSKAVGGTGAINSVAFAGNNSCPPPVVLPHGAVFSWEPICDGVGWLRPVILAMAYLSAGLIVVAGLRT